ncbi:MAG: carbohydrate-binding domain-containing protein [Solirubrobacteraceae bacterium]
MHQPRFSADAKRRNAPPLARGGALRRVVLVALAAAATLPIATASASTDVLLVEGESHTPGAGVASWIETRSDASNNQALVLGTSGSATKSVELAAGSSRVVLRARGTQCQGAPRASVAIDGSTAGTVELSSTSFTDFSMTRAATAGSHTVTVTFSNDRKKRWCDRTVSIDKLTFVQDSDLEPAPTDACGFGGFGVGAWPGACWRPYADTSPFNMAIPATATVGARSAQTVSRLLGFGSASHLVAGTADTTSDWQRPTYYSQATDPLYTLHCTESWGTCALEGVQIRVPEAARPAAGSDGHMTIIDQANGWEYPLWGVQSKPSGGGTLSFQWTHGRVRIDGSGLNGGGTAAHFGNMAGVIRAQEMAAGQIDHALFMVVNCDSGSAVFPAAGNARKCSSPTDAPSMGTRFQLNMSSAQIDALAVPAWKKTILRAMATYGMYVGDTSGAAWGLQFESGSTYTSFGQEDQMVAFGRNNGLPSYNGQYVFNIRDGVDWAKYLRVIDPCTTQGTC